MFARYCLAELMKKDSTVLSTRAHRKRAYLLLPALQIFAEKPETHPMVQQAAMSWLNEDQNFKHQIWQVVRGELPDNLELTVTKGYHFWSQRFFDFMKCASRLEAQGGLSKRPSGYYRLFNFLHYPYFCQKDALRSLVANHRHVDSFLKDHFYQLQSKHKLSPFTSKE